MRDISCQASNGLVVGETEPSRISRANLNMYGNSRIANTNRVSCILRFIESYTQNRSAYDRLWSATVWCAIAAMLVASNVRALESTVSFSAYQPGVTYHNLGSKYGDDGWGATAAQGNGFITYGPYTSAIQNGAYKASFDLTVDDITSDNRAVAYVDVFDSASHSQLARREIYRKDFNAAAAEQLFDLSFVGLTSARLEFRVFTYGNAFIVHKFTKVTRHSAAEKWPLITGVRAIERHSLSPISDAYGPPANTRPGTGHLAIIPLVTMLGRGNYVAHFHLKDSVSYGDGASAMFGIQNRTTGQSLARVQVTTMQLSSAETIAVPFEYDGVGKLEARVYAFGIAAVDIRAIEIIPVNFLSYSASDPAQVHKIGHAQGNAWVARKSDGRAVMSSGPKATHMLPGVLAATFNLAIEGEHPGSNIVAEVDAYDAHALTVLARRVIKRNDFRVASQAQSFDLIMELRSESDLEFRVHSMADTTLVHFSTVIAPDRLTLTQLWDEDAHFEFRNRTLFESNGVQDSATSSLIALDGNWYAFNRIPATSLSHDKIDRCNRVNRVPLGIVVRKSSDRGSTWSEPVEAAMPAMSPSTADLCEIVDGGAFFDGETDTWHYLSQCINEMSAWNLCHFSREGASPLGVFTSTPSNPVLQGGQLWGAICAGKNKACPASMRDEGTPQIIAKVGKYFYVTFHGADYGTTITGARGAARTPDFVHWEVVASDLPGNAMFSIPDCADWEISWDVGGCIGEGNARSIRSGGYFYTLAEAADRSLACRTEQTWVFGLFRNSVLGASGTWQSYPGNPFVVNRNKSPVGCALQYMNFIRDRGELFLEFSLYSPDYPFPNYLYELVDGPGDSRRMLVR